MGSLNNPNYNLAKSYNLSGFYDYGTGNLIIPDDEASRDVTNDILRFLVNNEDWVLGHQDWHDELGGYWYLTNDI